MFSAIVCCADCGEKRYYCTSKTRPFCLLYFKAQMKRCLPDSFYPRHCLETERTRPHEIDVSCAANYKEQFRQAMDAKQKAEAKKELTANQRQLTQAQHRIEELDRLCKRIYEDNANGKLSDSRFQILSDDYEQEQEELQQKLLRLNEKINEQEEQFENIDRFINKVRKYFDLDKLTPAVLNEMVKVAYVYTPDKCNVHRG